MRRKAGPKLRKSSVGGYRALIRDQNESRKVGVEVAHLNFSRRDCPKGVSLDNVMERLFETKSPTDLF